MPKRTDISSILVIGAGPISFAPFRGRGKSRAAAKGEGGVSGRVRLETPPSPRLAVAAPRVPPLPNPFPQGKRGIGQAREFDYSGIQTPLPGGEGLGVGERATSARPGSRWSRTPTQPSHEGGRAFNSAFNYAFLARAISSAIRVRTPSVFASTSLFQKRITW